MDNKDQLSQEEDNSPRRTHNNTGTAIMTEMRAAKDSIASSGGSVAAQVVSKGGLIHDNVR